MKILSIVSLLVVGMLSCQHDTTPLSPTATHEYADTIKIIPTSTSLAGQRVWVKRTHSTTFTEPRLQLDSSIVDSHFTCNGSSCAWEYKFKTDSINLGRFYCQFHDSVICNDEIIFAFFTKYNDTCIAKLMLLNRNNEPVNFQYIVRSSYYLPGYNNVISYTYTDTSYFQYVKPYKIVLTLEPKSNPELMATSDTIPFQEGQFVPIDRANSNSGQLLESLQGKWKLIFQQDSISYASSTSTFKDLRNANKGITIIGDQLYPYDSTWTSTTAIQKFSKRVGFSFEALPIPDNYNTSYVYESLGDTLLGYKNSGYSYIRYYTTQVFIRNR